MEKRIAKLYIKELVDKESPKTIRELFDIFYSNGLAKATYRGKNCITQHCAPNRMRSFENIYALCKTYIPSVTIEDVMKEILVYNNFYNSITKTNKFYINLRSCNDIKKINTNIYPCYENKLPRIF